MITDARRVLGSDFSSYLKTLTEIELLSLSYKVQQQMQQASADNQLINAELTVRVTAFNDATELKPST